MNSIYRKRNNYQETIAALLRYGLNLISFKGTSINCFVMIYEF